MNLENKVAIITGAGRGIGRETALALADAGAQIAAVDVQENTLKEVVSLITQKERKVKDYKCDVSNTENVQNVVDTVYKDFGKIDILINNAGITRDNLILRMSESDWDSVLGVNLKGAFNFTKSCARYMMKVRAGKIVNIASIVGIIGNSGQANYSASKGGLIAMTKTVARELASRGIQVNAVAPGFIDTEMTKALPEEIKQKLIAEIPLQRLGATNDIAASILFLCSPLSDYITGHVLVVDGGMAM
ncbi:MAG: 3-oxoacyl-[acyl-carrier-protein] reductase [Planctomycetota bacterium]